MAAAIEDATDNELVAFEAQLARAFWELERRGTEFHAQDNPAGVQTPAGTAFTPERLLAASEALTKLLLLVRQVALKRQVTGLGNLKAKAHPGNISRGQDIATQLLHSSTPMRYLDALQPEEISKNLPEKHVTKTAKKAGVQTTHRSPSKLPGYVPDSRVGTVGLTAHVSVALRTAIHEAAKKSKLSTQDYLIAVLTAAAAQQQPDQKPVKVDVAKAIEEHLEAKRADARKAALRLAASLR